MFSGNSVGGGKRDFWWCAAELLLVLCAIHLPLLVELLGGMALVWCWNTMYWSSVLSLLEMVLLVLLLCSFYHETWDLLWCLKLPELWMVWICSLLSKVWSTARETCAKVQYASLYYYEELTNILYGCAWSLSRGGGWSVPINLLSSWSCCCSSENHGSAEQCTRQMSRAKPKPRWEP